MELPIGLRIRKEVIRQGIPLGLFADMISVSRPNVYSIFARKVIDSDLLGRISIALNHNFFDDLADDIRDRLGNDTPKEMLTQDGLLSILHNGDDRELVYYDDDNREYKLKESLYLDLWVNDFSYEMTIDLPDFMFPWLLNSYARAIAGPMKGLDEDSFNQQFYPWLEKQCPRQARCIKEAVEKRLLEIVVEPDHERERKEIHFEYPTDIDDWYYLTDNKIEYLLDNLPERIIVTKEYKK